MGKHVTRIEDLDIEGWQDASVLDKDVTTQLIDLLGKLRVSEMFAKFTEEAEKIISQIGTLNSAKAAKTFVPTIHQFSGSAATFGLCQLRALLLLVEEAGGCGNWRRFFSLASEIRRTNDMSVSAFQKLLAS